MYVHPCCCIYFIEWSFFKFKLVLEILFKRFEQNINLENRKEFPLSLPVSGSAHSSPPPFSSSQAPASGPLSAAQQPRARPPPRFSG